MSSIEIDDEFRISIAREAKDRIEKIISQQKSVQIYQPNMLNNDALMRLSDIALQIEQQKCIDKNLDLTDLSGLLLLMLLSRDQPNIDQRDLAFIEESGDFGDFNGFFRDANVKTLFVSY